MFTGLGTVGRLGQGVGGVGGSQVSSLRRTAEKWDSVIQSEAELNRQLSQIITCLSEAISSYVKLCKAISSQRFFPQRLPSENRTQPSPSEPFRTVPKHKMFLVADRCCCDPDQTGPKRYLAGQTLVQDAAPHLPRRLAARACRAVIQKKAIGVNFSQFTNA